MALSQWLNTNNFAQLRDSINAAISLLNSYGLGNGDAASVNNILVPIGGGLEYYSTTLPNANFMFCDGSAISRTTYAALFALIGTSYGVGDGSSTFNLPNKKSRVGVGFDSGDTDYDTLGNTGGEKKHLLTSVESGLPDHTHSQQPGTGTGGTGVPSSGGAAFTGTATGSVTGGAQTALQAHENRQPYVVCNYIIRVS